MTQEGSAHVSDDDLETYSMAGRMSGTTLAQIEEHISNCELCRLRQEEIAARVSDTRNGRRLIEARERQRENES